MSWEVNDDEWLAPPMAVPGAGPVDSFDERVLDALSGPRPPAQAADPGASRQNEELDGGLADANAPDSASDHAPGYGAEHSGDGSERQQDAPQPRTADYDDLPPPPYSAAFDTDTETPSYESGSFVEDSQPPDQAPSEASEPEPDFHIPTLLGGLSLGAPAEPVSDPVSEPVPRVDTAPHPVALEPTAVSPASQVRTPQAAVSGSFEIPTLSRASSEPAADLAADLEEVEEVEAEEVEDYEVDAVPVRTGDTVIAQAPEFDEAPATAASPVSISDSVYDDEETGAPGSIPEIVERVDSSELEIVPEYEDTAVEPAPTDPDADTTVGPAPEPESPAIDGFVIPNLARSSSQPEAADVDGAVIPTLFASPADAATAPQPEALEVDEVEDLQEVDAEAIESLDTADLEELEQPKQPVEIQAEAVAVVETPEVKPTPPAPPPEAKPQAKRRKAWYDDVFAEHFLFLYPLTWEETCERDAQFMFSLLGAREGMSVLDVGCGDGHHAVQLAKLGARVTGLDNSLALLLAAAQAKEAAELEDGRVEFIHGDMRRLPRDREFDAVVCVGTTLGYFEEDQNWQCLQEMHDRLLPGGRLLIHVFNRDFIAPHLPSRSWWQGKRCMVIDEAEMNFFANRLRVHRTIIFDDGRQYEHYMFMRAYTVQDLGKAVSQLGMRVIEVSGSRDTRGRFYGSASPDIWIVAEKK